MSSSVSIIHSGRKTAYLYTGDLNDLTSVLTKVAIQDDFFAEAITRAAIDLDIRKQNKVETMEFNKLQQFTEASI